MKTTIILRITALCALTATVCTADELEQHFAAPPDESKPWCYWWWLNGSASKEGITRDFEEMRKQGIGGALLFDAGEAASVARGPAFMSTEWRELFKHAVREANRCGIVLTVNLCSGWNAGGPWVTHEHAAKKLVARRRSSKGRGASCCPAETGGCEGFLPRYRRVGRARAGYCDRRLHVDGQFSN